VSDTGQGGKMKETVDKYAAEIELYCCDKMNDDQRALLRVILAIVYSEGQRIELEGIRENGRIGRGA